MADLIYLALGAGGMDGMAPDLAVHTAISFVTHTNGRAYSGEVQFLPFADGALRF